MTSHFFLPKIARNCAKDKRTLNLGPYGT